MIKNQLLTIGALQSSNGVKGNNSSENNSMMNAIYGIILISIIEQIFKVLPGIVEFIKTHVGNYIEKKYKKTIDTISSGSTKRERTSSIRLERNYGDKDGQNGEYVESILEFISKLSNIKKLKYRNRFYISHTEEFDIEKDIYGQCQTVDYNPETGDVDRIVFDIYSTTLNIQELRNYLNKIHKNYLISKKNQLGDQTYFFDHFITNIQTANMPIIRFDMVPFNTNKSLKNIYGSYMKNIVTRIQFFIQNKDWYYKKGIPHTLGLLLHGPPGTGKTSLIKAIANDTHRHIINIKLTSSVTQSQLKALFFNEELVIFNKKTGQNEVFIIPLEQRIYVMEDVDAISEILYSREIQEERKREQLEKEKAEYEEKSSLAKKNGYALPPAPNQQKPENKEELTLAFILNLLDGILETPGRIIILTTNHPEKLDSALVRPGRIDLNVHFSSCSNETIVELVKNFYETIDNNSTEWVHFLKELEKFGDYLITPAEVNRIIFNHYKDPSMGYSEILKELDVKEQKRKKTEQDELEAKERELAALEKEKVKSPKESPKVKTIDLPKDDELDDELVKKYPHPNLESRYEEALKYSSLSVEEKTALAKKELEAEEAQKGIIEDKVNKSTLSEVDKLAKKVYEKEQASPQGASQTKSLEHEEFGKLSVAEKDARIKGGLDLSKSGLNEMRKQMRADEMEFLKRQEAVNNMGLMAANNSFYESFSNLNHNDSSSSSLDDFFKPLDIKF